MSQEGCRQRCQLSLNQIIQEGSFYLLLQAHQAGTHMIWKVPCRTISMHGKETGTLLRVPFIMLVVALITATGLADFGTGIELKQLGFPFQESSIYVSLLLEDWT